MDEEKKAELDWEEAERVGPYQLHEPVPRARHGQGEVYRATHTTSGATALVYKPAAEEVDAVPLKDWRVRLISSAAHGYIALEVRHSPWGVAPNKHSMEALVFLFEGVRETVRRMSRALPASYEPRPGWRLGLGLASAAAACALLFALVPLSPVSQPPSGPGPLVSNAPGPMSHEVPTAAWNRNWNPDPFSTPGEPVLARPLPREPFKGQQRPPCIRHVEVELIGACWGPHELKAPCPDILYEYDGKCYVPIMSAKPPPQSVGP